MPFCVFGKFCLWFFGERRCLLGLGEMFGEVIEGWFLPGIDRDMWAFILLPHGGYK